MDITERNANAARPAPPHIVVVGQWRQGHARLPVAYAEAISAAGGHPKIFSTFSLLPEQDVPEHLDVVLGLDPEDPSPLEGAAGLLLPGGGDIDPAWYGRPQHPRTTRISHRRDQFEKTLLRAALEQDLPVLAICHGMQMLSVHLGGTLDQHLADDPTRIEHDSSDPSPGPVHKVHVDEGCRLAEIFDGTEIAVNSSHHQGLEGAPGPLQEVAWAEDGVLEGVVSRDHTWVVGVQWHPEAMAPTDETQRQIFDAFVKASEDHSENHP
ncbi:MAG: putative glutamine amidotransferase [Actinomycetota bacterium]|nr:putative glutamine amidotransferase [Actinomycetota bacterium]